MFSAHLGLLLILLPLIKRILLQSFYHLDNPLVSGHILPHIFPDHHLATALRTHKYLPIDLHSQPHQYTLLTKTVTAFGDYFRYLVVQIVLLMAYRAMRHELLSWEIVHDCNWYYFE